jgi:hypothetical protein
MSTSSVTQPSRGAVRACWRIPSSTPHDTPFEQVRRAYESRGSWEGPPDTVSLIPHICTGNRDEPCAIVRIQL